VAKADDLSARLWEAASGLPFRPFVVVLVTGVVYRVDRPSGLSWRADWPRDWVARSTRDSGV
jgi:hypothetical protein